jgi:hypothetical protein
MPFIFDAPPFFRAMIAKRAGNHGEQVMPTIAYFYGIAIRMYFVDHPPPHFSRAIAGTRPTFRLRPAK